MKIWVTTDALGDGVKYLEGEFIEDPRAKNKYIRCVGSDWNYPQLKLGKDVFLTREEAVARVQELIDNKRANLQQKLDDLDAFVAEDLVYKPKSGPKP